MSLTYQQRGSRYNWYNGGSAVASGAVVVLASGTTGRVGIAVDTIATLTTGVVEIGGVQQLAKRTGEVFTDMQLLYWNTASAYLTGTSSGNTLAGRSFGTANSAAAVASVLLNDNPFVQ